LICRDGLPITWSRCIPVLLQLTDLRLDQLRAKDMQRVLPTTESFSRNFLGETLA
jgi:hypothetical protein